MALHISRISVVRGCPPNLAAGIKGAEDTLKILPIGKKLV